MGSDWLLIDVRFEGVGHEAEGVSGRLRCPWLVFDDSLFLLEGEVSVKFVSLPSEFMV